MPHPDLYGLFQNRQPAVTKAVDGEDEWNRYIDYYKLLGYDTDGDGIADVLPGEFITVTKDITLRAIFEDTPYSRNIINYD